MEKIKTYSVGKTAKSLKLQKLIYTLALLVGVVFLIAAENKAVGGWIIGVTLPLALINHVRIWWHHG